MVYLGCFIQVFFAKRKRKNKIEDSSCTCVEFLPWVNDELAPMLVL
jgi:hypothetical protein